MEKVEGRIDRGVGLSVSRQLLGCGYLDIVQERASSTLFGVSPSLQRRVPSWEQVELKCLHDYYLVAGGRLKPLLPGQRGQPAPAL